MTQNLGTRQASARGAAHWEAAMGQTTSDLNKDVRERPSLLYYWIETVVSPCNDAIQRIHTCNHIETFSPCAVVASKTKVVVGLIKGVWCGGSVGGSGPGGAAECCSSMATAHTVLFLNATLMIFSQARCSGMCTHTQTHTRRLCSFACKLCLRDCECQGVAAALG